MTKKALRVYIVPLVKSRVYDSGSRLGISNPGSGQSQPCHFLAKELEGIISLLCATVCMCEMIGCYQEGFPAESVTCVYTFKERGTSSLFLDYEAWLNYILLKHYVRSLPVPDQMCKHASLYSSR